MYVCMYDWSFVGLPPQIKWVRYAPGQHFTQYITKEHAIACDMYGTVGANVIRVI